MSFNYHQNWETPPQKYASVSSLIEGTGRLLEVGCHTGRYASYLAGLGFDVEGIELDAEAASVAKTSGLRVHNSDISDSNCWNNLGEPFDYVLFLDVLEHVANPLAVLQYAAKVIKPSGRLIVTAPNVAYWKMRIDLLRGKWDYADGGILDRTHLRFYTAKGWKQLFDESPFTITLFSTAESMIPVQQRIERIWPLKQAVQALSRGLGNQIPELFAVDFLIEARPR